MYIIANGVINGHNSNTMEAILLTKNASFIDGVLIDVRLTFDNKLVVIRHDDLSKNTLGKGFVSKTKYSDLRKVKFSSKIYKYYIPTLEEVLINYQSKKIMILNLHDAMGKNEILVNEIIKLIEKYDYNFYIETSSRDILEYLTIKALRYKIGPRFTSLPSICNNNNMFFCDTLYNNTNVNINTYSNIIVRTINNEKELMMFLKNLDQSKHKDLLIISDNPKSVNCCINNKNYFFR